MLRHAGRAVGNLPETHRKIPASAKRTGTVRCRIYAGIRCRRGSKRSYDLRPPYPETSRPCPSLDSISQGEICSQPQSDEMPAAGDEMLFEAMLQIFFKAVHPFLNIPIVFSFPILYAPRSFHNPRCVDRMTARHFSVLETCAAQTAGRAPLPCNVRGTCYNKARRRGETIAIKS